MLRADLIYMHVNNVNSKQLYVIDLLYCFDNQLNSYILIKHWKDLIICFYLHTRLYLNQKTQNN